jgi:hypothetical protein
VALRRGCLERRREERTVEDTPVVSEAEKDVSIVPERAAKLSRGAGCGAGLFGGAAGTGGGGTPSGCGLSGGGKPGPIGGEPIGSTQVGTKDPIA